MCATSSTSSCSDSVVKATRSANTTLTTRRSVVLMSALKGNAAGSAATGAQAGGRAGAASASGVGVSDFPPDEGHPLGHLGCIDVYGVNAEPPRAVWTSEPPPSAPTGGP